MRDRSHYRWLVALLCAVALVGLAGCGNDDDDDTAADATTTTEETTETTAGAAEPDDPAAAEEEIRTNISTLFVSLGEAGAAEDEAAAQAATDQVVAYIENGEANRESVATVAPLASAGLEVVIDSVTFTSDATADFQYDLLLGGNPTQVTDSTGTAVLEDGTWKLSEDVWGALVALSEAAAGGGGGGDEG